MFALVLLHILISSRSIVKQSQVWWQFWMLANIIIHLKYLQKHYVLSTILDSGNVVVNESNRIPDIMEFTC